MKRKTIALLLSLGMLMNSFSICQAEETDVDKSQQTRVLITTDGECDDQNSLRHMLLYANDLDIAGIVYSASTFHWQGDGEHTLAEITPENLYKGEDIDTLTSYRPQEMGWIENLINEEYSADYEFLSQNAAGYPTPEELLNVVKVGNVEFEGDVREATEGSEWIKQCILDDDERLLYLQTWGGFNTCARALMSIAEEYKGTEQWPEIYKKVVNKVRIQGHDQDTTWRVYIQDLYPDLVQVGGSNIGYGYFASQQNSEHAREMFCGDWLYENIKNGHGKMMENYHLVNDGAYYEGEPEEYQFGQTTTIGWGSVPRELETYDWVGEGDSGHWVLLVPVGLRGLENPNYGTWCGRITINGEAQNKAGNYDEYNFVTGEYNQFSGKRWLVPLQEDFAARADWTCNTPENCNHAPVVSAENLDITAAAGEIVTLMGSAVDPDGDELDINWWVYEDAGEYEGELTGLRVWDSHALSTSFTVPADAESGDYFNIILEVKDRADAPMTRYAQVIVSVE